MGFVAKADYRSKDEFRIVSADGTRTFPKPTLESARLAVSKTNQDFTDRLAATFDQMDEPARSLNHARWPYRVEQRHIGPWIQVPASGAPAEWGSDAGAPGVRKTAS